MKQRLKIKSIFLLIIPFFSFSQTDYLSSYKKALDLSAVGKVDSAYFILKELKTNVPKTDTLYNYVLGNKIIVLTKMEKQSQMAENFRKSLDYGLEAWNEFQKEKEYLNNDFKNREYYILKNILVSYMGLGNFKEAKKWKAQLYKAQKQNVLPEQMQNYFNFDFFRMDDKNVWGYEWFEELPKDRFSRSFTKIVYYVYSTNSDGSDHEQLYRLHVLMFHANNEKFDYVMTLKSGDDSNSFSQSLYQYTYKENIDYQQLQKDVKAIVNGKIKPIGK